MSRSFSKSFSYPRYKSDKYNKCISSRKFRRYDHIKIKDYDLETYIEPVRRDKCDSYLLYKMNNGYIRADDIDKEVYTRK